MNGPTKAQFSENVDEKLRIRKALQEITNRIHAAQNIKQILVDLKDGILNLFNAHSITIYVVDKARNEIYSMFLTGTQLKEIRVPISNKSIAGFVANTGKVVNISDACDKTGYKGRMGIHELLIGTDSIKRMVQKHEPAEVMRNKAVSEGMTTLLQDGILKAFKGFTDFKQVRRVCIK